MPISSIVYTDTPTSPVTPARSFVPSPINFGQDFRVLSDVPGEVVLTNIKAPANEPEKIRIAFSEIADAWKGTGTIKSVVSNFPTKGTSLLIQDTGVSDGMRLNLTGDAAGIYFPYSVHLVIKAPQSVLLADNFVKDVINRLLGSLYDSGSGSADSRIAGLVRGALTPADL